MIYGLLLILLSVYVLISAAFSYYEIKKLLRKTIGENERIKLYRTTILEGLLSLLLIIPAIVLADMTATELGLSAVKITARHFNIWISGGVLLISGIMLLLFVYQIIAYLTSDAYRKAVSQKLAEQKSNESQYSKVLSDIMLPKTRREKLWFAAVSLSAGITEEIMYRGFLFYLLFNAFPAMPVWLLLIIGAMVFGVFHSYQGLYGILKTGLMGLLFGALYLATNSLLPGIILHFILDVAANFLVASEGRQKNELE